MQFVRCCSSIKNWLSPIEFYRAIIEMLFKSTYRSTLRVITIVCLVVRIFPFGSEILHAAVSSIVPLGKLR